MKLDTKGANYISKGVIYRPGPDGIVDVPDEVLKAEKVLDKDGSGSIETNELVESLETRVSELEAAAESLEAKAKELEAQAVKDAETIAALEAEKAELEKELEAATQKGGK